MLLLVILLGLIFAIGVYQSYDSGEDNGAIGFGFALIFLIAFYVK